MARWPPPGAELQHAALWVLACCVCAAAASAPVAPMRDVLEVPAGAAAARRRARAGAGAAGASGAAGAAVPRATTNSTMRNRAAARRTPAGSRPRQAPSQRCQFRGAEPGHLHGNATGPADCAAGGGTALDGDREGPRCGRWPSYGDPAEGRARFCRAHAAPEHVNLKSRRCQAAGCTRQASFGAPGTRAALTCAQHKLSSHIDVRSRRCREPGCARQPSFYNSSQPSVLLCSHHARAREEREERGAGEAGAESGGGNVRGDRAEVAEPAVLPHCLSPVRRGKGLVLSLVRARVHAE